MSRESFRRWRGERPFWGGLLLALGGAEILFTEKASLKVVLHIGMQGLAGYLLPTLMSGFFLGLLLGAVGSCLAFGWLPDQEPRRSRRQRRRAREQEVGEPA
ncbi:DUF6114 domain-containing protein [Streptomyces cupreus]|uniref:Uncharacterized protein n=1 Tax=Streptomyces cupreus TaxID=2759956 RepID=A0A7X1J2I3_9ACTN|nr:DUF6114 domain-containing protein [Streptomyces cupreus]MBC2902042.1 hypothetical protein [Streptomyces cupreus]